MYLETYSALIEVINKEINASNDEKYKLVFKRNVLIESHAVHLRNLIEFFNRDNNCLTTETIFTGNHDLSFDDSTILAKQTINKAIDHLTEQRYKWNQTSNDLTIRFDNIIHVMYKNIIVDRIKKCVTLLLNNTDVKQEHLLSLHDADIQKRLQVLKNY